MTTINPQTPTSNDVVFLDDDGPRAIVVDNVMFTLMDNPSDQGPRQFWSAGPLAYQIWQSHVPNEDGTSRYRVNSVAYETFELAAEAAIRTMRKDVDRARRRVIEYDGALAAQRLTTAYRAALPDVLKQIEPLSDFQREELWDQIIFRSVPGGDGAHTRVSMDFDIYSTALAAFGDRGLMLSALQADIQALPAQPNWISISRSHFDQLRKLADELLSRWRPTGAAA